MRTCCAVCTLKLVLLFTLTIHFFLGRFRCKWRRTKSTLLFVLHCKSFLCYHPYSSPWFDGQRFYIMLRWKHSGKIGWILHLMYRFCNSLPLSFLFQLSHPSVMFVTDYNIQFSYLFTHLTWLQPAFSHTHTHKEPKETIMKAATSVTFKILCCMNFYQPG